MNPYPLPQTPQTKKSVKSHCKAYTHQFSKMYISTSVFGMRRLRIHTISSIQFVKEHTKFWLKEDISATWYQMTRYFLLIPKKKMPRELENYRSISQCNAIYKIIANIISKMLQDILQGFISEGQLGFIKGRSAHTRVAYAQEIVQLLGKDHRGRNVILKIDMERAFDKLE